MASPSLLQELLGQGTVRVSRLGAVALAEFRPLLDAGILLLERRGAGERLCVARPADFAAFVRKAYPGLSDSGPAPASPRARGLLASRNTKATKGTLGEPVLVRGVSGARVVGLDGLHDLGASERFGAFTFILREGASWRLEGERAAVGLVENLDAFLGLNIEALGPSLGVDAVIYTQGKLSGRVLDWLSSNTMADIQVLHLGDYDPVGLREYIRLRAALGARARIFLPPGLGKLFDDFASSKIMAKDGNQRELMTLVRMAMKLPADAQEVLEHIRRTNCGLEQEAFFLMSWPGLGPHPWRRSEAIF